MFGARAEGKVMITEERLYNMEALVGELSSTFESMPRENLLGFFLMLKPGGR